MTLEEFVEANRETIDAEILKADPDAIITDEVRLIWATDNSIIKSLARGCGVPQPERTRSEHIQAIDEFSLTVAQLLGDLTQLEGEQWLLFKDRIIKASGEMSSAREAIKFLKKEEQDAQEPLYGKNP